MGVVEKKGVRNLFRKRFLTPFSVLVLAGSIAEAADWPAWRADARRSAATAERLPPTLNLQWLRELPPLVPAWPDEPRMTFDHAYQPIVVGHLLIFGSSFDDRVRALDTETGAERWTFQTEGPVRFAPAAWRDRLFVGSDDGYLYALETATGRLLWKVRGGPSSRKVLGNTRLISTWPVRGAPVVAEGTVYFAAGIWPFMGVFVYALDAETGRVVWRQSGAGADFLIQPHQSPAFSGLAPQGYLAVVGDKLLVPNGRAVPACLDRRTGALLYYGISDPMNQKHGNSFVAADDTCFVNDGWVYDLADGACMVPSDHGTPVLEGDVLYSTAGAFRTREPDVLHLLDRRGEPFTRWRLPTLWTVRPAPRACLWMKAANRLYLTVEQDLYDLDLPTDATDTPRTRHMLSLPGAPEAVLAGDGKLFVATRQGHLACYGVAKVAPALYPPTDPPPAPPEDAWTRRARAILALDGKVGREPFSGYGLVLGLGSGRLIEELARQSDLTLIGIERDAATAAAVRHRLETAGILGPRATVHVGDPLDFGLPPYLASLVASEGLLPDARGERFFAERLVSVLRPYGGTAVLPMSESERKRLVAAVAEAGLANAHAASVSVDQASPWVSLVRVGALPGAGDWTHQYADPANTVVSQDRLVQPPLGLLWFGGSSNTGILPRHGHGPTPQVVGGRLFIEGPESLRCLDVYTGRVIWERYLPRFGKRYDTTLHQPGANSLGSNYVSLADGVYALLETRWLRLDPATGRTLAEVRLPAEANGAIPTSGFVTAAEDVLVVTASPQSHWDPDFEPGEFEDEDDFPAKVVRRLAAWVRAIRDVRPAQADERDTSCDFFARNLNALLDDHDLLPRLPVRANEDLQTIQRRITEYVKSRPAGWTSDLRLRGMNRQLLETANPDLPVKKWQPIGGRTWSGTSSDRLIAFNRYAGRVLWQRTAAVGFRHNTVAIGGGRLFVIDHEPDPLVEFRQWKGGPGPKQPATLLALDLHTGAVRWTRDRDVFGTWLGYAAERDLLLQARRPSTDMLDAPGRRMSVLRAADGSVLWDRSVKYAGPCLLHGDTIITQGTALDLLTGEVKMREHPITGLSIPWTFRRMYGCNTVIGAQNLLTYRSAAAGFCDLTGDAGTGNFGGFKSGCTSNLIPANGVLAAPDYTRTCTCSYPNQTSLALVPMPDAEMWTFHSFEPGGEGPVKRLGLNFGAPGDRVAPNGTLFLEYPFVGGPTPRIVVSTVPDTPDSFRMHSSEIESGPLPWVAASGLTGIRQIRVQMTVLPPKSKTPLTSPAPPSPSSGPSPRLFTVRLFFSEKRCQEPFPEKVPDTFSRVFDVSLQGKKVLTGLNVLKEAGGPNRSLVKEIRDVQIADELVVDFARSPASQSDPLICGLEIVAQ
jgi:outer membrane protein assembly factor BamB